MQETIGFSDFKKLNCLDINARVDYMSLNLMFNIFLIMWLLPTCATLIESRIVTTHAKGTQRMSFHVKIKGQGSKSFRFNGSKKSFGMNFQRM